jgi:hypothetical protein
MLCKKDLQHFRVKERLRKSQNDFTTFSIVVGMALQVNAVGKVGSNNNIVAIKVFNNTIFLQCYHPTGILVHAIINNKNGMAAAKGRFYQYSGVQL